MASKYDWLRSIGKGDMKPNKVLVLSRLPFYNADRAIAFVTKHFPEMTIEHEPIVRDPDNAQNIARITQYEVEYLVTELETVFQELMARSDKQCAKVKALEERGSKSLMDDVELSVAKDRLREYSHEAIGALQALQRVRTRMYELQTLAGKYASNWRL